MFSFLKSSKHIPFHYARHALHLGFNDKKSFYAFFHLSSFGQQIVCCLLVGKIKHVTAAVDTLGISCYSSVLGLGRHVYPRIPRRKKFHNPKRLHLLYNERHIDLVVTVLSSWCGINIIF